jgi:Skp family chaperone for outer membrane proteins
MGGVVRSISRGIASIFGGGHHREQPAAAPSAPAVDNSAQIREYQNALRSQQEMIQKEHSARQTELEAVNKRTQEGLMRSNRARRQGGIFTEAQTTNVQPSGGSLG